MANKFTPQKELKQFPPELMGLKEKGFNMAGFVPLLYSIGTDYIKGLRNILEIGVRGGTSTNAFLLGIRDRGHKNVHLYSMDISDCSGVVKDDELKKYWTFMKGDSKELPWDKEIDVLLIDGDHSYDGVKADFERFSPFVKEGGIILMHDARWFAKGVIKYFWDEIKYPKSILPLSKSGMGIVYKKLPPYYDDSMVKVDNKL